MNRQRFIIFILTLGIFSHMSYAIEQFCLSSDQASLDAILIKNAGSKKSLRAISSMMEKAEIKVFDKDDSNEKYFIKALIKNPACILLKSDESIKLTIEKVSKTYIPFLQLDAKNYTAEYGIFDSEFLTKGTLTPFEKKISTKQILDYKVDPKATVIYVTCPASRNELCTLKIKYKGAWIKDGEKDFEMKVLGRSRRERGDSKASYRLLKEGDTPQGIYRIWGTLFTNEKKFGNTPRIDIDGMQPPVNFMHAASPNFKRVVPKEAFLDYWVHEFPLAYAMGRYLFRIHDNSVDPNFPDTFITPFSKKPFRATAGCLNTGDQMKTLLPFLQKTNILNKAQVKLNKLYGRIDAPNIKNSFLIVIDED